MAVHLILLYHQEVLVKTRLQLLLQQDHNNLLHLLNQLARSVLNNQSRPCHQHIQTVTSTQQPSPKSPSQQQLNIGQHQQIRHHHQQQEVQRELMLPHQQIILSNHLILVMFQQQLSLHTPHTQLHHRLMDMIWVTNQLLNHHQLGMIIQLLSRLILMRGVLLLLIPLQLLINDGFYLIYLGFNFFIY